MYDFKARIPFDHAMSLVRLIRSGDTEPGIPMMLIGSIVGELGAWRAAGNVIALSDIDCGNWTMEELCGYVDSDDAVEPMRDDDASFDPGIWIPVILKIIELWLARRGQK